MPNSDVLGERADADAGPALVGVEEVDSLHIGRSVAQQEARGAAVELLGASVELV